MTKELSLIEIRTIAEKIYSIIGGQIGNMQYEGLPISFGNSYSIGSWGKVFTDKVRTIYEGQDKIVLSFCQNGETQVPEDKIPEYYKELTEYLSTKDTITYTPFRPEWLGNLEIKNLSILHQFVEQSS